MYLFTALSSLSAATVFRWIFYLSPAGYLNGRKFTAYRSCSFQGWSGIARNPIFSKRTLRYLYPPSITQRTRVLRKGHPLFLPNHFLSCCHIDYNYALTEFAPIAQLDRALVFGTSGWEFEPLWAHFQFPRFTRWAFPALEADCSSCHPPINGGFRSKPKVVFPQ